MAKTRKLLVEIVGDSDKLDKAYKQGTKGAKAFGDQQSKLGKTMRATGKAAKFAGAALGAGIAAAAAVGVKGLIADEKAMAKVESTLKSTSNAANVTKEEILKLSDEMQANTGVGGDLIRTNQSVLLTFTNVKNGVKEGDKIFDRATRTMLDMSVALDQDMKASAIGLGKALNNPIKGVTALSRVGVDFTDMQIEQIRTMQSAGNTMGAQKVILQELERQFGGTADAVGQTAAGQWARAKVAFEEVAKTATKALLPILTDIADWMNRKGIPALHAFVSSTQKQFEKWEPKITTAMEKVRQIAQRMADWFNKNVRPVVKEFVDTWKIQLDRARALWQKFGDDITRYLRAIMRIWGPVVKTGLANIRDTFRIVLALIRGDWGKAWDLMKGMLGRTMSTMGTVAKRALIELLPAVVNLASKVGIAISAKIGEGLAGLGKKLFDLGRGAVVRLRDGVASAIKAPANAAIGGINAMLNAVDRGMPVPDFLPTIPKLAEGDVVSRPTLAVIGEDGPEAVIPLSAKRRKRGQELMTKAATMLNLPGDYPGPASGIRLLADGGIFGAAKSFGSSAVSSLKGASAGAGFDAVSGFAKRGLSSAIGTIPSPRTTSPVFNQVIGMVRDVLIQGLRSVFSRKEDWSFGQLGKSLIWSRAQMGKPYVWGGGHGGWDYNLRGYDCSGGASHAAKLAGASLGGPGTTFTLSPVTRRGVRGPFEWGFRGMGSSNPRRQHMGWKIRDTWYQFGSPGRSGGTDAQWEYTGVPPGLPSYRHGTPFVPETGLAHLHRGEAVIPEEAASAMRAGAGGGATVVVEQMVVRDATDAQLVADQLGRYLEASR